MIISNPSITSIASLLAPLLAVAAAQDAPAPPRWETLLPTKLTSEGGATLTLESDGAILVGGALPDKDVLVFECAIDRKGVTGFRLEALADPRLPAQGPGTAGNGNFVLTEFEVAAAPKNSDGFKPVVIGRASADFEQPQFPIVGVLDGVAWTGWAISPAFATSHEAIFETQRDVGFDAGAKLVVTLRFQFGGKHTIGKLRLSTTTSPRPLRVARQDPALLEAQGRVPSAITRGVRWLLEQQELDGSWPYAQPDFHHGMTALACYTLLKCGVRKDHPAVVRARDFMSTQLPAKTYEAGLELMARAAFDDEAELPRMQEIVDRMLAWQVGGWSYPSTQADLSNTQYAALGLRAAAQHGAKIPAEAWLKLGDAVLNHQEKASGAYDPAGFGYYAGGAAFGSVTTGGVCVLQICHEQLDAIGQSRAAFAVGAKRGVAWLDKFFAPHANPKGDVAWLWYWLYGVERVGGLCKVSELGGHDWYREGARQAVEQQKAEGAWDGGGGLQPSTCFALLFLARATSSVSNVTVRGENLYGGDDPKVAVSLRASGDTPLAVWISSFGEEALAELAWPEDGARGPRVAHVDYVLPGRVLAADARDEASAWRFTTEAPTGGWELPAFDDRKWRSGPGAFGLPGSIGTAVRTEWRSDQLWLRREVVLDETPLVNPTLRVHFSGAAPVADLGPSPICLFDEEPAFAGLFGEGGGTIRVDDHDAFAGRYCLAVTPQQVFRAAMPGWGLAIAEKPRAGEYRFLRFAWRKEGGSGIMLQLAQNGAWDGNTRRVVAGQNEVKWAATEVAKEAPRRWTVVTVDLWKEFGGNGMLTGIAFTPMSATAGYYDAFYLARSVDDFKAPPKPGTAAAVATPAPPAAGDAAAAVATGEGPALDLYVNGTRVYAASDELADYVAIVPSVPLAPLLRPGRNVIALQARRIGPGQSIDVGLVDERVLAAVDGNPDAPCGAERFPARFTFEKNGTYEIRARVRVRSPAAATAGSAERLLESAPLAIPIREAPDVELLSYAKDPARNLIAQVGAVATATSAFDANWLPGRAIDNYSSRGWLSSDADRRPWLTIELNKPVRADTLLVTPIQMRGADPERAGFRVRRVEIQIDQGRGGTFELTMPEELRKGTVRLPKVVIVRRIDLRILDATGVNPAKPALGVGEVELQLRK